MRILLPAITFDPPGGAYAPRPSSLAGLRVGLLDGWGDRKDNAVAIYPTLGEIEKILSDRFSIGESVWQMKPSITEEVPEDELREFLARVDVVINGEGL
jgi:hypothetical protein